MTRLVLIVALAAVAPAAAAQPQSAPATGAAAPAPSRPAVSRTALPTAQPTRRPASSASKGQELRFDALRIDGTLHGPEAVTIRSALGAKDGPLHAVRRSFVRRILSTLESPCLHR